jgi:hypothetical protein
MQPAKTAASVSVYIRCKGRHLPEAQPVGAPSSACVCVACFPYDSRSTLQGTVPRVVLSVVCALPAASAVALGLCFTGTPYNGTVPRVVLWASVADVTHTLAECGQGHFV